MGFTKLWTLEYFSTVSFCNKTLFQKLLGLKWAISCKKILIRNIFEGHFRSICTQAIRLLSGTVGAPLIFTSFVMPQSLPMSPSHTYVVKILKAMSMWHLCHKETAVDATLGALGGSDRNSTRSSHQERAHPSVERDSLVVWLHFCSYLDTIRVLQIQGVCDTQNNPADVITRGMTLSDLAKPNQFSKGPAFLQQPHDGWPNRPFFEEVPDHMEMKRSLFCGLTATISAQETPLVKEYPTFEDLLEATSRSLNGVVSQQSTLGEDDYAAAELVILQRAQSGSFPEEIKCLQVEKAVPSSSSLVTLAPECEVSKGLIRVGGRLRHSTSLEEDIIHPIMLEPKHPITRLIIQQYDDKLLHSRAERVFVELRRKYWILRGREAVSRHQRSLLGVPEMESQVNIPKMADSPHEASILFNGSGLTRLWKRDGE